MKKEINFYKKNGFVVIKKIITEKQIEDLLKEVEVIKTKAFKTRNKRYFHFTKNKQINTVHNIQKFYKSKLLEKLSQNPNIKKFVKNILSKKFLVRNYEFFLKPAKTGMPSPLHQDNFFWNIIDGKALNAWIALSDANSKNGGIYYLKGSHKLGTLKHVPSYMKGTSQMISKKNINNKKMEKVFPNLKKGDCLIHHCEVMHGSNKNISNKNRVGIAISYKSLFSKIDLNKKRHYEDSLKKTLKTIYN